uniref:Uncharacterized protein n=1 Tax=Panagrolaimus sp. PS1159 TaxID=55785 RepID=A0AC35GQL6_9BILA
MGNQIHKNGSPKPKSIPGRIPWPDGPPYEQYFSLPDSIIYYMTMNPSTPKCSLKIIQSCKYFFEKNSILVVKDMEETSICINENCSKLCCETYFVKRTASKFWLTKKLFLLSVEPSFIPKYLRPKIYQSQIKKLGIHDTKVNFNDFLFFASTVEILYLTYVEMTYNDGKNVMIEKILEAVPQIQEFLFFSIDGVSVITESTLKHISKLQNLSNFKKLTLIEITEALNLEDLCTFSKARKDIKFEIYYLTNQISQEYKDQLDEIIAAEKQAENSNLHIKYRNWEFPFDRIYCWF